jgi:hypothetical protein
MTPVMELPTSYKKRDRQKLTKPKGCCSLTLEREEHIRCVIQEGRHNLIFAIQCVAMGDL